MLFWGKVSTYKTHYTDISVLIFLKSLWGVENVCRCLLPLAFWIFDLLGNGGRRVEIIDEIKFFLGFCLRGFLLLGLGFVCVGSFGWSGDEEWQVLRPKSVNSYSKFCSD